MQSITWVSMKTYSITPKRRPVTIKDVAAKAGVSTATVSRLLAGKQAASSEVKNRVLRIVEELGYEPNHSARNLRTRQRKVFGIVIPDLENPFFTGIIRGAEETLRAAGYSLLIAHSDESPEREEHEIRVLRAEGAMGLLLIPSRAESTHYSSSDWGDLPVVAIDRVPMKWVVDSVKTANAEGARLATEHLIHLGHQRIAILNGPAHYDVAQERLAGFRQALAARGQRIPAEWVVHGDFRQESGFHATKCLLQTSSRPRAIFVANHMMALGALMAIHELGLCIPADVAIASFDDMPWGAALNPPLTAVAQPTLDLGRTAATLLLERQQDPLRPVRQVILQPSLVVRASCGAVKTLTGGTL